MLIVGATGSRCGPTTLLFVPQCPDTPDRLFEIPLPEDWEEWYLEVYDPFCEGLRRAAQSE